MVQLRGSRRSHKFPPQASSHGGGKGKINCLCSSKSCSYCFRRDSQQTAHGRNPNYSVLAGIGSIAAGPRRVRTGPCSYREKGLTARKGKVASQSRNKGQIEIVYVESVRKQGIPSTFTDTRSGITRRMKAIKIRTGEQLKNIWQGGD